MFRNLESGREMNGWTLRKILEVAPDYDTAVEQIKKSASSWWGRARQVLGAAIRAPLQLTNAISALFIQHRSMMLTVLVSTAVVRSALMLV